MEDIPDDFIAIDQVHHLDWNYSLVIFHAIYQILTPCKIIRMVRQTVQEVLSRAGLPTYALRIYK